MKKNHQLILLVIFCCFGFLATAFPQTQVGIPIKKQEAYVLDFKSPFDRLTVDLEKNKFTTEETSVFVISPQTIFVDNKNKPLDKTVIRRGMRLEITGERVGERLAASHIKVKTDVEKWEVKVEGIFESLDGDRAWIDGQVVKLLPETAARGTGNWKGKTFRSFNDMELGAWVDVSGIRQTDGIVYAVKAETKPNLFSKSDEKLKNSLEQNVPKNLVGGTGKIMGREVKFSDSLALQTYVTRVGNRLIPRYHKEMPNDYPGKIVYRFAVIEDDSFNAYGLPDGSVFVHTGLLKQIKNEAQLAAVLSHEIAHVTHEHSRKKMDNLPWMNLTALGVILAGGAVGGRDGAAISTLGALAFLNSFDRGDEDQADRIGLYYMTQAGYDAREAPKIWRELAKNTQENAVANFIYSRHSLASQRLRHLNRHLAYGYAETDFRRANIGKEDYDNVVGIYFGWATAKPAAPPGGKNPSKLPAETPKPIKPTPKPKPKPRVKKRP